MIANAGCFLDEDLSRFLLGRLPEHELAQVSQHLSRCGRCVDAAGHVAAVDPLVEAMRAQSRGSDLDADAPVEALVGRMSDLVASLSSGVIPLSRTVGGASEDAGPALATERDDFLAPPASPDEIGRLGPYRVLGRIGAGGMGIVYRAEEPALNRLVALKVMRPALASGESARRRFLREAQAAASIRSDHVVAIHRVGEDRGIPYLAMPLLRGESLETRLRRGALAPAEIARIGREVAEGLATAHASGLVHRDLKPDNIWLEGERGRVVVLDFGLARPIGGDPDLTGEGAIVGTPAYMAPEQANGDPLDHRCDLFSLGSVLYAMCTGKPPFVGRSNLATIRLVSEQPAVPITAINPGIPVALVRLIEALHAKNPADRPQSAAAVAEALGRYEAQLQKSTPPPAPSSGQRLATAARVVSLLVALFVFGQATRQVLHVSRTPPPEPAPIAGVDPDRSALASALPADANAEVYPAAILSFEERGAGVKPLGAQTSDILFARLAANPNLMLVDRADLTRTLEEQALTRIIHGSREEEAPVDV